MLSNHPAVALLIPANRDRCDVFGLIVTFVLAICLLLIGWSHVDLTVQPQGFAAENGMLENLQQLLLALAGLMYARQLLAPTSRQPRVRSLILVAICITFLLRETDVAGTDHQLWLRFWVDESGKKILLTTVWLAVIFFLLRRGPLSRLIRTNGVLDATCGLLVLAGILLFAGLLFDRKYLVGEHRVLIEEQLELAAYALMFVASHPGRITGRQQRFGTGSLHIG